MTTSQATVNGVRVCSNKSINGIINNRITFSDGGWCDVRTGEVVNKGAGYISIVGSFTSRENGEIISNVKKFIAPKLQLSDFKAEIDIQPYGGSEIEVTVRGQKLDVDSIGIDQSDDTVILKFVEVQAETSEVRVDEINIGKKNILSKLFHLFGCIFGSYVSININDAGDCADVLIKVPKNTEITITGIDGSITIGDTEGLLKITTCTSDDISIGSVGILELNITGSACANVESVKGKMDILITGSGEVDVDDGDVDELKADINGSGEFRFDGRAINADLSITGSGDINVSYVRNAPIKKICGSGDIEIGNG